MRPVFYDYPDAIALAVRPVVELHAGRRLLVAPPPKPESPQAYDICLPAGGWYDYWTGKRVGAAADRPTAARSSRRARRPARRTARATSSASTPALDSLPVFVRAGTILPRQAVVQSTVETPRGR